MDNARVVVALFGRAGSTITSRATGRAIGSHEHRANARAPQTGAITQVAKDYPVNLLTVLVRTAND